MIKVASFDGSLICMDQKTFKNHIFVIYLLLIILKIFKNILFSPLKLIINLLFTKTNLIIVLLKGNTILLFILPFKAFP